MGAKTEDGSAIPQWPFCYQYLANDWERWLGMAETLRLAARCLSAAYRDVIHDDIERLRARLPDDKWSMHDDLERAYGFSEIELLLYGLAIENLLKSLIVHKRPLSPTKKGKLPFKGHDLLDYMESTGLNPKKAEKPMLNRLSAYIEHEGRYPVPIRPPESQGDTSVVLVQRVERFYRRAYNVLMNRLGKASGKSRRRDIREGVRALNKLRQTRGK